MKTTHSLLMVNPFQVCKVNPNKHSSSTVSITEHLFSTLINITNNIKSVIHHFIHIISITKCKVDTNQVLVFLDLFGRSFFVN